MSKIFIVLFCLIAFISTPSEAQVCSLGDPVFIENFGNGTSRLGPSLNQDPINNVHPNFRPADLYTYVGTGSIGPDQYSIMKNPKDAAPGGASWNDSFSDHTGNFNGYLYYCDAKEDLNVFYAQKIDGLCPDIEYELSAWFAKTNAPDYFIDPNIKLIIGFTDINDDNLGTPIEADSGPIEGIGANRWHRRNLIFSAPVGTENIYFMLKNNVSGTAGNDLAIDDIEVRPCGPQIDIIDQSTSSIVNNTSFCVTDSNDLTINISANIPNNFVMQWQESTTFGIWTDISNETSNTLNYTIPENNNTSHAIRLKFAHNSTNLLNNKCHFFTEEVTYNQIYINTAPDIQLCDDDNNGTMPFNLTLQDVIISPTSGAQITYHRSRADANSGNAPITSPFESGNTTIFARVENDLNTSCFDISSFDLEVYDSAFPLGAANITPIQECDNTSVGTDTNGFIVFDLTQRETEILNGQSASDFSLTYFTDATYLSPILTPNAFSNNVSGGQTIYVRMTNNWLNNCYTDTYFKIEVFELPILNTPSTYSQCDDTSNDGVASFNLTLNSIKEEIDPDHVAKNLIFSYYLDSSVNNPIPNPQIFQNSTPFTPEIVWIGVEDSNGCFSLVSITLEVTPSSAALALYNPTSIYQCDDGLDDRDGVSTFDISLIKNHISTTIFSTFNVTVHFYESQLDAELETNEILDIANHQNTNSPNTQDIWVRVKSDLGNNCLGLEAFPNLLTVEALPFANPIPPQIECDNDIDINDGMFPFDTTLIETTLLNGQSLTDVSVNFTYLDIDGITVINSATLPTPFLTPNQTVIARVTNNNTLDPDGACYDETAIEFKVDIQPIANPVSPLIVCDGDSGDLDDDGVFPFDTSVFSSTVLGTQSSTEIYFDYVDENGNSIIDSPSLPNPLISGNQTIVVEVINPDNMSCTATTTIELVVNPLPEFTINPEEIVCTSDPTFTVMLDPIETNINEPFIYEWAYEDGSILSNNSTLTVSTPGRYSITLTKTDGTGCSRTLHVDVKASEKATITQDDVTITDLSENNSVIIDPTNLGLGDYEYALRGEDAPFTVYQEDPSFNNVKAGFYTIYVRDAICGISTLDISVIGHSKFFTPNGDTINDHWKIKGINATFQPNSTVLIYDRYGKLLKQLTVQSDGWDGTFNGTLLPTDDYWFKVFLQDGREFSGHFTLKR
ncbi:T9SS type B sorting domain-containing protein [Flavivirga spongiicola]|uniref:T9SS type B sorting domain-containing protein n=1 Tax=Flavivirga spongiicola TaxID=421621 RepID=A0ABU7XP60_9FLAO|nr:T9SS type B sorting domain-containing protein [Flavivirga sp. MEBiC05379]MDO5977559.1 T9SS type B sorting domain-containing protein [Flavivirga sp. MEBiC05379]